MSVKEKISKLLEALNEGVYEREGELSLALLSSIAGESIFLLGPPGVAKSLVARKLKYAYKDAKVFEYLMSRFSTPDEIFGPVSISKLKNEDKYERVVEKYLPSSDVVFLDEIWKAGPSIQNALLTVINEKIFRNGDEEIKVPMKALISASNELPAKDQGLEALWDRFLLRLSVKGIDNRENFNKMISEKLNAYEDNIGQNDKITNENYEEWSKEIDEINVPENVLNVIHYIRNYIAEYNEKKEISEEPLYVSDRRWRKIVRLLRTSAFLNDRKEVDLMDCFLIKYCIWSEEGQIDKVWQFVRDAVEEHGYTVDFDFKGIKEELEEFKKEVDTYTHVMKPIKHTENKVYNINNKKYLRILNLQGKFNYERNDLIERKDIISAKKNSFISTTRHREDFGDRDPIYIKQGQTKHSLILSNSASNSEQHELQIEIIDVAKDTVITQKPHPSAERDWDKKIDDYLKYINDEKEKIEQYCKDDLEHLCTNLFVNQDLAEIVKSHITATMKKIDNIELEVKAIQHGYKILKDAEIIEENKDSEDVDCACSIDGEE